MSKRPFPYDDATEAECLVKRVRLVEKLEAVNTRLRVFAPPQVEGPKCRDCSNPTVVRTSKTEKNMNREFWSCEKKCPSWTGWLNETISAPCVVCKKARKIDVTGDKESTEIRNHILDKTYVCQTCADDAEF